MRPSRLPLAALLLAAAIGTMDARQAPAHSGFENASFDQTVRPADDLYGYVNNPWIAAKPFAVDQIGRAHV